MLCDLQVMWLAVWGTAVVVWQVLQNLRTKLQHLPGISLYCDQSFLNYSDHNSQYSSLYLLHHLHNSLQFRPEISSYSDEYLPSTADQLNPQAARKIKIHKNDPDKYVVQ